MKPLADILPDGRIRLSASQVKTYRLCPRKWAFTRTLGYRGAGKGAEIGSAVHEELERWLRDGMAPRDRVVNGCDVGRVARAGIPHLPAPRSPGLEIECEARVETPIAVYTGRIDWRLRERVGDHKTLRDFKYAMDAEELLADEQAAIYGLDTFKEYPKADVVSLEWNYLHTERADASRPLHVTASREQLLPVLQAMDETADEMRKHVGTPHDVPPDARACQAFGGCPYLAECGLTAAQRIGSIMSNEALKARLAAKAAASATPAASSPTMAVNPPPVADAVPTPTPVEKSPEAPAPIKVAPAKKATVTDPEPPTVDNRVMGYRDHVAIAAMAGIVSARTMRDPDEIAAEAYVIADAMARARSR